MLAGHSIARPEENLRERACTFACLFPPKYICVLLFSVVPHSPVFLSGRVRVRVRAFLLLSILSSDSTRTTERVRGRRGQRDSLPGGGHHRRHARHGVLHLQVHHRQGLLTPRAVKVTVSTIDLGASPSAGAVTPFTTPTIVLFRWNVVMRTKNTMYPWGDTGFWVHRGF